MTAIRVTCTAVQPWVPSSGQRSIHPDAVIIDSECDCCEKYRCPHCQQTFKVELPD